MHMPAANLAPGEIVRIPVIAGMVETLRYSNRDGTSEFLSGLLSINKNQAIASVKGAMTGAGWTAHEIQSDDAIVFSIGDPIAPSAVAAAHAGYSNDGASVCITVIARAAGAAR